MGRELGAVGPKHTGADGSTWHLQLLNISSLICYPRKANFTILSNQAVRKHEKVGFFFYFPYTTPLSLKGCQKAYPDFPELYSTHIVIHTCALCTSVTTSPQDLFSRGFPWEQVSSITTSRAKKMNQKHESLQPKEGKTARCSLSKPPLFTKGPRLLQLWGLSGAWRVKQAIEKDTEIKTKYNQKKMGNILLNELRLLTNW